MKNYILLFVIGLMYAVNGYAETAFSKWPLTSTTTITVIDSGGTVGQNETFSNLIVYNYSSGFQKVYPGAAWPINENVQNDSRYIQFETSPQSGCIFTVTSVEMEIGGYGGNNLKVNIWYSTDSTFTTCTKLNSAVITLSPKDAFISPSPKFDTLNVTIGGGQKFYIRIYPWWQSGSSGVGKYVGIQNVIISGAISDTVQRTINISTPTLSDFGPVVAGNVSSPQSYTVSGDTLRENITITAPTGFQVST